MAYLLALYTHGVPWLLIGDFNVVADTYELLSSSPPCLGSIGDFVAFGQNLWLTDVAASAQAKR